MKTFHILIKKILWKLYLDDKFQDFCGKLALMPAWAFKEKMTKLWWYHTIYFQVIEARRAECPYYLPDVAFNRGNSANRWEKSDTENWVSIFLIVVLTKLRNMRIFLWFQGASSVIRLWYYLDNFFPLLNYFLFKTDDLYLTHCGPVTPYGDINLGQLWLR